MSSYDELSQRLEAWPAGIGALIVSGLPGREADSELPDEALYPSSTTDIIKLLREQGIAVDYAAVDKLRAELSLNAAELWVPLIVFAREVLTDGGAHVLVEVV